ncbi:rho GTPase-activating protein 7-like isoform X2 [Mytilus trossulus]|uniref:rho GTPase-activating protein 7-like isoform X2 n=1 Tax=Mytilus trossulus TaxID=6551 RepID=UPI003007CD90
MAVSYGDVFKRYKDTSLLIFHEYQNLMPYQNGRENRSLLLPSFSQEYEDVEDADDPWEKRSESSFPPPVEKIEKIISSTLKNNRGLQRSLTSPNFSTGRNGIDRSKYQRSKTSMNSMEGEVFYGSDQTNIDMKNDELFISESDIYKSVCRPKRARSHSTTGIQTSIDENFNFLCSEDKGSSCLSIPNYVTIGTNTTDSLKRPKKKGKIEGKPSENCVQCENKTENRLSATKPNSFPEKLQSVHLSNFMNDESPEMQMVVNATSPVINRRNRNRDKLKLGSHSFRNRPLPDPSSLQIETAKTLPEVVIPQQEISSVHNSSDISLKIEDKSKHSKDSTVKEGKKGKGLVRSKSKKKNKTNIEKSAIDSFDKENSNIDISSKGCAIDDINSKEYKLMKKELAQTWHGISSKRWKKFYSPVAQAVWNDLEGKMEGENKPLTQKEEDNLKLGSSTMPTKTLLDTMHKKYCAYQYKDTLKLPSPDDLVMHLKLKSSPPPPDRMKSKEWIMRHYVIPPGKGAISTPSSPEQAKKRWMYNERETTQAESFELERKIEKTSPELSEQENEKLKPAKEVEVEAVEATRWLKEAGFPQYAQMYDDGQFPVDIISVEKDHDFLDRDSMQPLIRRLSTLNKCAIMRIVTPTRKTNEDSDDDEQCALSDKWKYQPNIRRWSRKGLKDAVSVTQPGNTTVKSSSSNDSLLADQNSSSETGDSPVLDHKMHHEMGKSTDDLCVNNHSKTMDNGISSVTFSPRLRRAASERIKGAKNFLKRVESFKSRKNKRLPRTAGNTVEISGPVIDSADMKEKIKHLNCKDLSPTLEDMPPPLDTSSPLDGKTSEIPEPWSSETTDYKQTTGSIVHTLPKSSSGCDRTVKSSSAMVTQNDLSPTDHNMLQELDLSMSISDSSSDTSITSQNGALYGHERFRVNRWNDNSDLFYLPQDYIPGKFPKTLNEDSGINLRTGSFSYSQDNESDSSTPIPVRRRGSTNPRVEHRGSFYDNVPLEENLEAAQEELDDILHKLFQDINGLNKAIYGEDAEDYEPPQSNTSNVTDIDEADDSLHDDNDITSGTVSSPDSSDHDLPDSLHDDSAEHIECRERRDSGVGSSLTRAPSDRRRNRIRWHSFQKSHRPSFGSQTVHTTNLSVCQLMVLQKLSLCKLTGLIEKYSQNRSGWSWTVPRFMKRHKIPNYQERNVFGIPLLVTLQRTGQPLPQCMLYAMRYLRKNAADAIGIFRKAGVRSRIQKLKNEVEANPDTIDFDDLQAYDVADLLKQYFRELPECLMTNKLSEIFLNIFISLPVESRLEALQATVILLPDENREVLQSLLYFLADISKDASEHQMTASNLAVCFAPSLFSLNGAKSLTGSPSPRRPRKNLGVPDARELLEQKAAHECLTTMITDSKQLFTISEATMSKCRFSYIEQGDPISLQEFNNNSSETEPGYQAFVENSIQGLLKESHDKFRGWVSVSIPGDVDVSFKKVGDGHPLRLWKCCVDVEAPPEVVLERVRDERHIWDEDLLKWHTVEKLDDQTDVFQYERNSLPPHPATDFCILRGWRTDLPKGSCALVSTSVDHPKVEVQEGIQGVVLVSHFLIEPCGTGKSRIIHMSRTDLRGRTAEWYKKSYGHICVSLLERIRDSFKQDTTGPESVV